MKFADVRTAVTEIVHDVAVASRTLRLRDDLMSERVRLFDRLPALAGFDAALLLGLFALVGVALLVK